MKADRALAENIWPDESSTMSLVQRGFTGMLSHLSASESAPPTQNALRKLRSNLGWPPLSAKSRRPEKRASRMDRVSCSDRQAECRQNFVPNFVPDSAIMTPANQTYPHFH